MPPKKDLSLTIIAKFDCHKCINKLKTLVGVNCFNGISNYRTSFSKGVWLECDNYKIRSNNVE